jgi:hypothetical protein
MISYLFYLGEWFQVSLRMYILLLLYGYPVMSIVQLNEGAVLFSYTLLDFLPAGPVRGWRLLKSPTTYMFVSPYSSISF